MHLVASRSHNASVREIRSNDFREQKGQSQGQEQIGAARTAIPPNASATPGGIRLTAGVLFIMMVLIVSAR